MCHCNIRHTETCDNLTAVSPHGLLQVPPSGPTEIHLNAIVVSLSVPAICPKNDNELKRGKRVTRSAALLNKNDRSSVNSKLIPRSIECLRNILFILLFAYDHAYNITRLHENATLFLVFRRFWLFCSFWLFHLQVLLSGEG
jgi:hypothetical protein